MRGWLQGLTYLLKVNRPKNAKGQIMTLMILLTVVMLIFVLATFEIGDTSIRATKMANAADQAALSLASSLASKGRMMAESLPEHEPDLSVCQRKAFWSVILTVVALIFCPMLAPFAAMLGNYFDGNAMSWYQAAFLGVKLLLGVIAIALIVVGVLLTCFTAGVFTGGVACYAAIVAGIAGISGILYGMYTACTQFNNALQSVNDAIAKMFVNLEERDRFRESAIYTAMNLLNTDYRMSRDNDDIDGDGDKLELVPDFGHWWYKRMAVLVKDNVANQSNADTFMGQMRDFSERISCSYRYNSACTVSRNSGYTRLLAPLETVAGYASQQRVPVLQKTEYTVITNSAGEEEAVTQLNGLPIPDGKVIRLTRAMENAGISAGSYLSLPIYLNGPSAAAMNAYADLECCPPGRTDTSGCSVTCDTPAGYDWMDELEAGLRDINSMIDGLREEPTASGQWPYWISFFYNSENPSDADTVYGQLGMYMDAIANFQTALTYPSAPACVGGYYNRVCVARVCTDVCGDCPVGVYRYVWREGRMQRISVCGNCVDQRSPRPPVPCRMTWLQGFSVNNGITLTERPVNVVPEALAALNQMSSLMSTFRRNIVTQASRLTSTSRKEAELAAYGGLNPSYSWTDSNGRKTVSVTVGPFKTPRWHKRKTWRKTCISVRDYSDDGTNCWVRVTETQTPSGSLGILGSWNPFRRSITKTSRAYYTVSYDDSANTVGIRRTNY